ncbi:hypothetical protein [Paraliobacillus sediminis]|uniref:hypothetical protein n=1 Tax=Paraliobacillus sediminis TaxID=1885916 RepID=UPI000E3CE50C|nr:hypothetical protein [Paraliobacillus sediminis]
MQLTKAWEAYKAKKQIEGFSPHTLYAYRLQAKLLVRHFQDINPKSISTQGIKEYLSSSNRAGIDKYLCSVKWKIEKRVL